MLRLGFAAAICMGCTFAQDTNPLANDPKASEIGRGMFRIYCAPCHGIRAQGGRGPDLTRGAFAAGDRDGDIFRTISKGVAGTEMGSYANLGDDSLWRLVAYVRSISGHETTDVPGDAAHGSALFWEKGGCGRCHAVGARGSRLGPDLTRIGRQRSLAYLRTSILDPSDDLAPGYATLTVITRDGKTISGLEKGLDNFSCQLIDLSGRFYSFDRSALKSVKQESRSLMPAYTKLSGAELTDLLAYLASLKGTEVKP